MANGEETKRDEKVQNYNEDKVEPPLLAANDEVTVTAKKEEETVKLETLHIKYTNEQKVDHEYTIKFDDEHYKKGGCSKA